MSVNPLKAPSNLSIRSTEKNMDFNKSLQQGVGVIVQQVGFQSSSELTK